MKTARPLVTLLCSFATLAFGSDAVDYQKQVKPILAAKCFACHGALKQESGLRLDAASLIRNGGDGGAVVVAGESAASVLLQRVSTSDLDERMPPQGEGEALTPDQVAIVRAWIDQGAVAPDEPIPPDPREHWAFQLPKRPAVPALAWGCNEIDAFIAAGHEQLGIQPVSVASKRLLLRRVYLDLIGLPPTREQIQAFLADRREDAYERVVDQLLDSKHYGERWGRHWMDVWRYTDWYGLGAQLRYSQKHIWHWRDWIVESLNEDKGYDRMIMEMLAADEIAPTDQDALRATGFLARNYFLFNRTTWLDNTIEHTSKAFLGLTLNCAKCHDHKYDPLSQRNYYQMRAFFEPHQVRLDPVPGQIDLEKGGLPRVFDAHPDAPTYLHIRGDAKNLDKTRMILPGVPEVVAFDKLSIQPLELPPQAYNPALHSFVLNDYLAIAQSEIEATQAKLVQARKQLAAAETSAAALVKADGVNTKTLGKLVLEDNFAAENPKVWETGAGEWKFDGGKLIQTQTGASRAFLRSRVKHPADFQATLKFKTTGGQQWKSVGLAFDIVDDREKMIYLSAVQPGSKLQVSYKTGANQQYPTDGKQDRPVSVNELYELTIAVRDQLVNVALDGKHALAYQLPVKREVGKLDVVAFDAAVEFHNIEIRELPPEFKLVEAGKTNKSVSIPSAKAAVDLAEKALAAAQLRPSMLRAAHAAEIAKHQPTPPENLDTLVGQAAAAALRYDLAVLQRNIAAAEKKLTDASDKEKDKAAGELKAAREKLQKKQLAPPSDKYNSLTASLKALEGPAESDASRRQPYPKTSTGRRSALARWIAHPKNPLTARVAVNHLWLRHFGQPLVEPVTDFGRRAPRPTHQELLDWLAVELVEHDWSMKHLHRLMVTSHTYRVSTATGDADEATLKADPNNRYYWRRNSTRMESEVIRDSLLHLAGALDPATGGPTIDPTKQDSAFRRSIYFTRSRDHQNEFLSMFDDADILRCYRRTESIVPQQALTLANSKLALTMSRRITQQLQGKLGDATDGQFVTASFETLLCAEPTPEEIAACLSAIENTQKLLAGRGSADANSRARANFVHALLNHNDFITIR